MHSGRPELPPESPSGVVVAVSGATLDQAHVRMLLGSPQTVDQALDLILYSARPKLIDAEGLTEKLSTLLFQTSRTAWPRRARLLRSLVALCGTAATWPLYLQLRQSDLAAAKSSLLGLSPLAERVALLHAQVGLVIRSLGQDAPLLATAFSPLLSDRRHAAALLGELYLDGLADCARSTARLIGAPDTQKGADGQLTELAHTTRRHRLTSGSLARNDLSHGPGVDPRGVSVRGSAPPVPARRSGAASAYARHPAAPTSIAAAQSLPPFSEMDWPTSWRVADGVAHGLQRATAGVDAVLASPPLHSVGASLAPAHRSSLSPAYILMPHTDAICAAAEAHVRRLVSWATEAEAGPDRGVSPAAQGIPHGRACNASATAGVRTSPADQRLPASTRGHATLPAAAKPAAPPPARTAHHGRTCTAHDGASRGHRLAATATGQELVLTSVATILLSLRLYLPGGALLGHLPAVDETLADALHDCAARVGEHLLAVCGRVGSPPDAAPSPAHTQTDSSRTHPPHDSPPPPPAPLGASHAAAATGGRCLPAALPHRGGSLPTPVISICLSSARALDFFLASVQTHNQPTTTEPPTPPAGSRGGTWTPAAAALLAAARAYLRSVEDAIRERLCEAHARLASACALVEPRWLTAGQGRPGSHGTGAAAGCSYGLLSLASGQATLRAELLTFRAEPARPLLLRTLRLASLPLVAAYWAHPPTAAAAGTHRADMLFLVGLVLTHCPEVVACVGAQGRWARRAVALPDGGAAGVADANAACGAEGVSSACGSVGSPPCLFSSGASEVELVDAETPVLAAAVLCLLSLVGLAHAPPELLVPIASGWRLSSATGSQTAAGEELGAGGGGEGTARGRDDAGGVVSAADWESVGARVLSWIAAQDQDGSDCAPAAGAQLALLLSKLGGGTSPPAGDPVGEHLEAMALAARAAATAKELDWDGLLGAMPLQAEPALLRRGLRANGALRKRAEEDAQAWALAREIGSV